MIKTKRSGALIISNLQSISALRRNRVWFTRLVCNEILFIQYRARGKMFSRIIALSGGRYLPLMAGRLESQIKITSEYSEWTKAGLPELTTINEIKVNLQDLVQSSKVFYSHLSYEINVCNDRVLSTRRNLLVFNNLITRFLDMVL